MAATISLCLADSADPRLCDLVVQSVIPTSDGARLLVVVRATEPVSVDVLDQMHDALIGARAWLRSEVAGEIHRKRTPDLAFRVLPPWEEP